MPKGGASQGGAMNVLDNTKSTTRKMKKVLKDAVAGAAGVLTIPSPFLICQLTGKTAKDQVE